MLRSLALLTAGALALGASQDTDEKQASSASEEFRWLEDLDSARTQAIQARRAMLVVFR